MPTCTPGLTTAMTTCDIISAMEAAKDALDSEFRPTNIHRQIHFLFFLECLNNREPVMAMIEICYPRIGWKALLVDVQPVREAKCCMYDFRKVLLVHFSNTESSQVRNSVYDGIASLSELRWSPFIVFVVKFINVLGGECVCVCVCAV